LIKSPYTIKSPPQPKLGWGANTLFFANAGILETDDGSVWFIGVGTTGKQYSYDEMTITVF